MAELNKGLLEAYREKTYNSPPYSRIHTREEAVQFVNQRGFIFFWPINGISLPSLWVAAAGNRPVPDDHDDPGHITWDWKDSLLGKGKWYYGRVLARKNCMISLEMLPFFYALSPNYGEPEEDYLEDYRNGTLPLEAKNVYEALLKEGALDSIALRKAAHLSGTGSESRFNKALEVLQTAFRLVPVGISTNGAWHYSFVYDLFHRHFQNAINSSRIITEKTARVKILKTYLLSVGACQMGEMRKLFHWDTQALQSTIDMLVEEKFVLNYVGMSGEKGSGLCLPNLINTINSQ